MTTYGADDLPWQMAGPEVMRMAPPNRAYHLDGAYAVVVNLANAVMLRSIVVLPEKRGTGRAHRLLRALFAAHPDQAWRVSAICPEEIGSGLLQPLGFTRSDISQFQMTLAL